MTSEPAYQEADVAITGRDIRSQASLDGRYFPKPSDASKSSTYHQCADDIEHNGNPHAPCGLWVSTDRTHLVSPAGVVEDEKQDHDSHQPNQDSSMDAGTRQGRQLGCGHERRRLREVTTRWIFPRAEDEEL